MIKSNEELLAQFKKANQGYKLKLYIQAGFNSAEAYIASLTSKAQPKKKNAPKAKKEVVKPTVHIIHIIDISGSMNSKIEAVIEGVNQEVSDLKQEKDVNYLFTLIEFSNSYDIVTKYNKLPLNEVERYDTYTRGMTALYQAAGQTLENYRLPEGEKALVKIFTDGGENSSGGVWASLNGGAKRLTDLVDKKQKEGFTIAFIGTTIDVAEMVTNIKIHVSNTLSHDNTLHGIGETYSRSLNATKAYSKKVARGEDVTLDFFSKEEGTL